MKHECENCAYAKESDGTGMIVMGNVLFFNSGDSLCCTAKTIAKMDLSGDDMFCSSFKPREDINGV